MLHVIGIGSPFGADDIGWRIVERLCHSTQLIPFASQLTFEQSDRPGASLLAMLEGKEDVVLIDAMVSGAAPGTVRLFQADEFAQATGLLSSHGFGVCAALTLASALGVLPLRLQVAGVEIAAAGWGSVSTPWLEEAVAKIEAALIAALGVKYC